MMAQLSQWNGMTPREQGKYYWQMLSSAAKAYRINLDTPVKDLPEEKLAIILFGTGGEEVEMDLRGGNNRQTVLRTSFEGVIPNLMRRFQRNAIRIHPLQNPGIHER